MNISVVVQSNTGFTKRFAGIISKTLKENGHSVDMDLLETDVPVKSGTLRHCREFDIINPQDCSKYDYILIGGPVWAFSASPVIVKGVQTLKGLTGKKVIPFATMFFPFRFMGGRQALDMIATTAEDAGAEAVSKGFVICRAFHDYKKKMDSKAGAIARIIG